MRGQPKLIKRSDSPFWFIRIPQSKGQRASRFSTGETDYREADAVFTQWKIKSRKPQLDDNISVIEILERYAEYKSEDQTVHYHLRHLRPYFTGHSLEDVSTATGREYTKHRKEQFTKRGKVWGTKKVSPGTARRELDTLIAAINFAVREGLVSKAPYIEKPSASPQRERWLTVDELNALLSACKGDHLKTFILIASITTSRPGAILQLKWFQVDFEMGIIHFNPEGRTQNNKNRPSVAMSNELSTYLKAMREKTKSEYVISYREGKPVKSIKKAFREACNFAGLSGVTPYVLRHTAITMLIRGGKTLAQAGQMAGHKEPRTTSRYAKHDPSNTRDSAELLSSGLLLDHFAPKSAKKHQSAPE